MREKNWCLKSITHLVFKMSLSERRTKHLLKTLTFEIFSASRMGAFVLQRASLLTGWYKKLVIQSLHF